MSLIVNDSGLSTTIQDAGRPGYREWGVGPGGAFDRGSADLANALLGNSADCAVLELTLTGGVYEAACASLGDGRRTNGGEDRGARRDRAAPGDSFELVAPGR